MTSPNRSHNHLHLVPGIDSPQPSAPDPVVAELHQLAKEGDMHAVIDAADHMRLRGLFTRLMEDNPRGGAS